MRLAKIERYCRLFFLCLADKQFAPCYNFSNPLWLSLALSMPSAPVRKAVIPAAGLGTRMLPATKAIPKEMLPVFDRPLIHYAVQELFQAGIESVLIVTGLGKHVIENHFAQDPALEQELARQGKTKNLRQLRDDLPKEGSIAFVRQSQRLGLGHAVWCARHWLAQEEAFVVSTPDELLLHNPSCLERMLQLYRDLASPDATLLAAMSMDEEQTQHYGVLQPRATPDENRLFAVENLIEKPERGTAPSTFCSIGRYILPVDILDTLDKALLQAPPTQGEIQLTDIIAHSANPVYGWLYEGERYDCGRIGGWIAANVAIASEKNKGSEPHWRETVRALQEDGSKGNDP